MSYVRRWTTCKTCGRVVYVEDVNTDGLCCVCAPPNETSLKNDGDSRKEMIP